MNISFGIVWDIVIDDVTDPLDIKPTGSDIGCNKYVQPPCLEIIDGFFPLFLRDLSVQRGRRITSGLKFFCQLRGGDPGPDKNDHAIECFTFQNPGQCV